MLNCITRSCDVALCIPLPFVDESVGVPVKNSRVHSSTNIGQVKSVACGVTREVASEWLCVVCRSVFLVPIVCTMYPRYQAEVVVKDPITVDVLPRQVL